MDVGGGEAGPRDPLIPTSGKSSVRGDGGGEGGGERRRVVVAEVRRLLWLAGPLVLVSLLQYSLNVISVMFVGHLGELALAGASMATSFAGVTGFSLLIGSSKPQIIFTSFTMALSRYGNGKCNGYLLWTGFWCKTVSYAWHSHAKGYVRPTLVSIPLAFIWACTGNILLALGQDPEISREAGLYARWMIPSLFAYGLLQCHVRFLQTQSVVFPMMLSSGITALLHLFTCWILVFKSGLGNKGAALANCISYWVNVSILAIYVRMSPSCKNTWTGFSREALHDVGSFFKLAVPSAVMVCLEFWSFECLVLLSGLLPNPTLETSVLSICLNSSAMIFMVPFGFGNAVSTRVSNELGAGHPQAARLAVIVVVCMAVAEGFLVAVVTVLVRGIWGYLYSSEEEVVKYVAIMLPVIATSNFLDGIQCVLSGALRGCGRQKIGAYINLGAYYIVGIPSSVLLAFVLHIGGKGLWLGIICGLLAQVLLLMSITTCTDWEKEARKSKDRLYGSGIPVDVVS